MDNNEHALTYTHTHTTPYIVNPELADPLSRNILTYRDDDNEEYACVYIHGYCDYIILFTWSHFSDSTSYCNEKQVSITKLLPFFLYAYG